MTRYVLALVCALISIVGISQETWTEVSSDVPIVGGLYDEACELLTWDESWESDCITAANYYVDTLVVPAGTIVTSFVVDIIENNTYNINDQPHFAYGDFFPGGNGEMDISSSDYNAPGIAVIDLESGEIVEYIFRAQIANTNLVEYTVNTLLWEGSYQIQVINECLFDNAVVSEYYDTFDWSCSISYPEFCWLNPGVMEFIFETTEDFLNVGEQDIVIEDITYNFEGLGFSNESETLTVSESDLAQPFASGCDDSFLDWANQPNGGYNCILSSEYYVKSFSVPNGKSLAHIGFTPTSYDLFESDVFRGTYKSQFDFDEVFDSQDYHMMRGVYVVDSETEEVVFSETRYEVASIIYFTGYYISEEINLPAGDYLVYVISDEGDNLGYETSMIDIDLMPNDFEVHNPRTLATNLGGEMIDGPEIVIDDVQIYFFDAAIDFEANLSPTYSVCADQPLDIGLACDSDAGFEFLWEVNVPGTGLWPDQDTDCTYNFQEPYDTTANNWNIYDTRVIVTYPESYEMEPDTSDVFQIEVMPNPSWDFQADALTFDFIDPDLLFSVELVNLNYPDEEIDGDYNWEVSDAWQGANLELAPSAGGYSAEFLFNPFVAEEDTIASFTVDATALNGCTTLDTTYVVYMDLDGDGEWSPGDSIDFRSFIIIPTDTTVTDTTDTTGTFIREFGLNQMKLYPNPTQNNLVLEHNLTEPVMFDIYSMNGMLVRSEQINQPLYQTSVADLPKGIYIVSVSDGETTITSRLVKLE